MRIRFIALAGCAAAVLVIVGMAVTQGNGFSTRAQPSTVERVLARMARRWAMPGRARDATNPVPFSSDVWAESRAHFADHCATCHGNDGSGQTEIGQNLYPKAPDMRLAETQSLADGELYWIIANGVRLTGMPASGTGGDNDTDTWQLVHFIRRLKDLTPELLAEMKGLNPRSLAELEEEREDQKFLAGEDVDVRPSPNTHDHEQEKP